MKKMKHKKIISLALTVMLALSATSMSVWAEETESGIDTDTESTVQLVAPEDLDFQLAEDTIITAGDLQKPSGRETRGTLVRGSIASARETAELVPEDAMTVAGIEGSRNTRAVGDGIYMYAEDYLTGTGDSKYWFPIEVYPGEVLHVQTDMPNNPQINYDTALYEVDADLILTEVDYSSYQTYINGTAGTIPEAMGVVNNSSEIKQYAVFVDSIAGGSISQSFTVHVGINTLSDRFETDEIVDYSIPFTLEGAGNTIINARAVDTMVDNDWYELTVGADDPGKVAFSLDSTSAAAGYQVEVYTVSPNYELKLVPQSGNQISISPGQYYFRVSANVSSVTGQNYTLTLQPQYLADEVVLTQLGGGTYVTYDEGNYYRVDGNKSISVRGAALHDGFLMPNATVTVTVENPSWSGTPDYEFRTATVTTDSTGYFTATINNAHSTASRMSMVYGAITFEHYYDIGILYAESGTGFDGYYPIYIFAYSIYVG